MNCDDIELFLQLAQDGEIINSERSVLDEHLSSCVACRRKEAWLELLDEQFARAVHVDVGERQPLADSIVAALRTSTGVHVADRSSNALLASQERGEKRAGPVKPVRKKRLFSRVVSAIWSRGKRKRVKVKPPKAESGWIDASVGALMPAPTSLDGFRAAKQGVSTAVSGQVQAWRWVAGFLPRRSRSQG